MTDFAVTYDQSRFHEATKTVDWGVLVSEWQGSALVCIVAESPDEASDLLRGAADAIMEDAKDRDPG